MSYQNPEIPEGINVSETNELKEFVILVCGVLAAVILLVFVLSILAQHLAPLIPFETETALVTSYTENMQHSEPRDERIVRTENYLQQLGRELAMAQNLPEDFEIHIHYIDDDTVNAFATLGGHIMIHRGLVEHMPHENALAMVLAHEIAHIHHRDPIVSLGRGVTVGLALAVLVGASDSSIFSGILGQTGLLTTLSFSRSQESKADKLALKTLMNHYGHSGGAGSLFDVFETQQELQSGPAFLSTHPVNRDRIEMVNSYIEDHRQSSPPEIRQLPDFLTAL